MKRRAFVGQVAGVAGMVGLGSALLTTPRTAAAQTTVGTSRLTAQVRGTINRIPVAGTMVITQFAAQGTQLVASGVATLTNARGAVTVVPFSTLPVLIPQAACEILSLTLGPLDLNVLGLEIHLDRVDLQIVANPAGGLLGQLLCAIAGLLNGGLQAVLQQVITLLNQLLAIL